MITHGGKEIKITRQQNSPHWVIHFGSGGQTPKEFDGMFVSYNDAKHAVNRYLSRTETKEKGRGTSKNG